MRCVALACLALATAAAAAAAISLPRDRLRGCTVPPVRDHAVAWIKGGIVYRAEASQRAYLAAAHARTAPAFPLVIGDGALSPDGRRWARLADDTITVNSTIYHGTEPAWSTDSTRLAYVDGHAIHVARPGTEQDEIVAEGIDPAWSADGNRLTYATSDAGRPALATVPIAGGARSIVWRAADTGVAAPAWSTDGSRIAFVLVSVLAGDRVATVAPDGSHFSQGPVVGTGVGQIRWSPRGHSFAFTSYNAGFGANRVVLVRADGRYRPLPDEAMQGERFWVDKVDPYWSADGRSITYTVEDLTHQDADGPVPGARSEVWIANVQTMREQRLTYHCQSPLQHARVVYGTHLADTILVRDGVRETVFCGRNHDIVIADRRDIVARDCEVVRR